MRSRSRMRRSMRAKLGSKSFNDLDDSVHLISPGKRSARFSSSEGTTYGHRAVRSSLSFGGLLGSMGGSSSVGGGQQSPRQQQRHRSALSGRRAVAVQTAAAHVTASPGTGVLTSESSCSTPSFAAPAEKRGSSSSGGGAAAGEKDGRGGGGSGRRGPVGGGGASAAGGVPYDRTTTVAPVVRWGRKGGEENGAGYEYVRSPAWLLMLLL
ncbi:hypothetical protein Esi_0056_0039 [Ectocarpus siliculosus]|uniref:Uncharacterized protein n=1 Tax=Ectocarpus siliculosus TaxID=2880 RepID=D8LPX7_ECTSI|nr:hypothetical protein Esi_0056_0039 [Ectocarpus siliculosus]|eukprot:CBN74869.1 hypothetical protein Esi_0056_0039 [Ectocarpus siliculosus]